MKTVMIFGSFDILHYGHLHLFKHAREYGEKLVAVLGRDTTIRKMKSIDPFHTEEERFEILKQFGLIDEVVLGHEDDVYKVLKEVRPDIIALGYDQHIFVDRLAERITDFGLDTRIVRLPPYKASQYKTSNMRSYLDERVLRQML